MGNWFSSDEYEDSEYPRFAKGMAEKYPSYEWAPIEVTTADDYILTLFHVWNPETRDETKSPVLV